MIVLNKMSNKFQQDFCTKIATTNISPVMEEGLLIGIAIVAILIVLGIVFGVFDWISDAFGSIYEEIGIFILPI